MKKSKSAGFTLIELAIVLVVIGLIIAAVLKGEDLIQNARMLNFVTNPVQKAQVAAMAYYDRTGSFPNQVVQSGTTSFPLDAMYQAGINGILDLKNPFTVSDVDLGIAFTVLQDSTTGATYPVMIITPMNGTAQSTTWTAAEIGYINYLKSKVDGNSSDFTSGSIRYYPNNISITFHTMTNLPSTVNTATTPLDGQVMGCTLVNNQWVYSIANLNQANTYAQPTLTNGQLTKGVFIYFYNNQPY